MREAAKIGKYLGSIPESKKLATKVAGINLSATAPDAFGAMERITAIAHADPGSNPTKKLIKEPT
eukprot:CAMPEP_0173160226 /NCGR_PEP_ID=MMETSP1105-20130129/17706_1 /TAXON_ID=2985 /ORGANISM="Ochromonas sp., Strain BG-1" /LENGTH=64 /DNA_ID=CAMNT_0014079065 /DNA_START=79 /DNA_END=269 /DNA_ORIENTATION=-